MIDDIERLDDALEGRPPIGGFSGTVGELVGIAAEVARALAVPVLTDAERERLHHRVLGGRTWSDRLLHELPRLARRPTVVGGVGAAAVTLAVVGIALLRGRSHPELGGAAA
ncbi:MAG TPA: hypothetical protein VH134_15795 [Candidatus Dormibacteraeota bacterium]|nr:hypothetical protein [Candidatus Dormibacteraeota bacterium]